MIWLAYFLAAMPTVQSILLSSRFKGQHICHHTQCAAFLTRHNMALHTHTSVTTSRLIATTSSNQSVHPVPIIWSVWRPCHIIVCQHSCPVRHHTLTTSHEPVYTHFVLRVTYMLWRPTSMPATEFAAQPQRYWWVRLEKTNTLSVIQHFHKEGKPTKVTVTSSPYQFYNHNRHNEPTTSGLLISWQLNL